MATVEELKAQMAKNSSDWHTAGSTDQQNALHQANTNLQKQIDSMTGNTSSFNSASGTWGSTPTTSSSASGSYVPLGSYNDSGVSSDDKSAINSLKQAYANAVAQGNMSAAQNAHAQAEKIRSQYGYSTTDGSDKILIDTPYNVQKQGLQTATPGYDQLKELYAAQQAAALQNLKTAYDSNMQDVNAAQAKIAPLYQAQRNQTASTSAVNRANFNEQAAAAGLNTGAGSQAALSQANALTNNINTLNSKEAEANTDIETQRLKLQTQYNNAIAQAQADNNAALAQALYNEYVRVDNSLVETSANQAQINNTYSQLVNQYKQQDYENKLTQAINIANATGDYSAMSAFGWTPANIAQAEYRWNLANPIRATGTITSYSKSHSSSSSKKKKNNNSIVDDGGKKIEDESSNISNMETALDKIASSGKNVSTKATQEIMRYYHNGMISESTKNRFLKNYS